MSINVLVLTGEGINCERETAYAFTKNNALVTQVHVNDFLNLKDFDQFDILVFPGGFSFGDEIQSGKILAEKIKLKQSENIKNFMDQGKLILGICNGFQILTHLGVFDTEKTQISLSTNSSGKFINKWVNLIPTTNETNCIWAQGLDTILQMPARHKEGRIIFKGNPADIYPVWSYSKDINGSYFQIAALTNKAGNVLGIMPHPEAALNSILLPNNFSQEKTLEEALANKIFKNAISYSENLKLLGQKHAN